jgi:hypothetical protein
MKLLAVLPYASLALGTSLPNTKCHANDCARQVTGTRAGLPAMSIRQSQCSSFMLTTITPSPV